MASEPIDYVSRRRAAWYIWGVSAALFAGLLILTANAAIETSPSGRGGEWWLIPWLALIGLTLVSTPLVIAGALWARGWGDAVWYAIPAAVLCVEAGLLLGDRFVPWLAGELLIAVVLLVWPAAMVWAGLILLQLPASGPGGEAPEPAAGLDGRAHA